MTNSRLFISAADLITAAGWGIQANLDGLLGEQSFLYQKEKVAQGCVPAFVCEAMARASSERALKNQDPLIRLAVLLARGMAEKSRISSEYGVIFGSSRGPTHVLEASIAEHSSGGRLSPHTSPCSTASSLSAALARELGLRGPSLSVSAACATGIHAIIQAVASIRLGLAKGMVAGGAEYANTDFTLDMLRAAKVYADSENTAYPCRPGSEDRTGMVLGEGAAAIVIETDPWFPPMGELVGWGAATEDATLTGISEDGLALSSAVSKALEAARLEPQDIDLIVGHGAGTKKGDAAELSVYRQIFADEVPLVFHKWMFGHMLGASACASLVLGMHHLNQGWIPPHPYMSFGQPMRTERRLRRQRYLLVSALGFGGNATALIVKNPALSQV